VTADEAKAIVDRFAAADPSMATIASVAKQLIDQAVNDAEALSAADRLELVEFRAKADAERIADAARKRRKRASAGHPPDIHRTSADGVSARARSSSSFLARLHQLRRVDDAKVLKSLGRSPKGRHYRG
jgi:hypothetical protein